MLGGLRGGHALALTAASRSRPTASQRSTVRARTISTSCASSVSRVVPARCRCIRSPISWSAVGKGVSSSASGVAQSASPRLAVQRPAPAGDERKDLPAALLQCGETIRAADAGRGHSRAILRRPRHFRNSRTWSLQFARIRLQTVSLAGRDPTHVNSPRLRSCLWTCPWP